MSKRLKIIIAVIVLILLAIFVVVRMDEDTWICNSGQWIKHGVPSVPMPEGTCNWLDNFNPFR